MKKEIKKFGKLKLNKESSSIISKLKGGLQSCTGEVHSGPSDTCQPIIRRYYKVKN